MRVCDVQIKEIGGDSPREIKVKVDGGKDALDALSRNLIHGGF